MFSQSSAIGENQTSALKNDVRRCGSRCNVRDECKSPQLSKLCAEIHENLAPASQKLDARRLLEFLPWRPPIQHDLLRCRPERWPLGPDRVLIRNLAKTRAFCTIPKDHFFFFCTSSSKRAVITPVHFGSRFTFFHQLGQMLTRCTLSSFLGQIVFIFSRHSNPNRRFHLFSFGESVFSGIFSGSKIIWKGVSFLFLLLHLLPARGAHKS